MEASENPNASYSTAAAETMSAKVLYALQDTDVKLAQGRQEEAALEDELRDQSALLQAQQATDQLQVRLRALQADQKDRELEAAQLQTKLQEVDHQMYSGRVHNPRELEGMEAESQHLRTLLSTLEEGVLQSMLQGDDVAQSLHAAEALLQQEQERLANREGTIQQRLQQVAQELEDLERQRGVLAGEAPPQELQLYEHLRSTRNGHAVARLGGGRCRGCNIAIPTQEFQRARGSRELVQCGSCNRILFVG